MPIFRPRPSGAIRRFSTAFTLAALVIVGLSGCLAGESYTYHGGVLDPVKAAPPLDLTDQHGQPFSLATAPDKVRLIYFGYTTCPDFCPTTLTDFLSVKEDLGDAAQEVEFILVTVDPERDTQARLQEYLAFFDPEFVGLRGDQAQTDAALRGYGVYAQRSEQPGSATGYLVDHSTMIYVLDEKGNLRLTYPYGTDPADMTEDVRHLLDD
jgi:protein SCO1/2